VQEKIQRNPEENSAWKAKIPSRDSSITLVPERQKLKTAKLQGLYYTLEFSIGTPSWPLPKIESKTEVDHSSQENVSHCQSAYYLLLPKRKDVI